MPSNYYFWEVFNSQILTKNEEKNRQIFNTWFK
jgi:hypothetical protein